MPPMSADIVGRVTAEPTTERDMQRRRVLTCYDAGSPIRSGCSSMASRGAAGWSWTAGGDDGEVRHVDRCWSGDGLLAWRDGRLGDFSKRAAQLYDRIQVRRQRPVEVGAVRAGPLVFVQVLTHLHAAVLLPGHAAVLEGSCWSARSRGAARTNELDAGERRLIIGSEEGSFRAGWRGLLVFPGAWRAEWSRKHPSGACVSVQAAAMTMCPGTGLLSHVIEPGLVAGSCRWGERARGW